MRRFRRMPWFWLLGFLAILALASPAARADQVWTVSVDTSALMPPSPYTGPFALDFELVGSNGNTVTLSGFSFGAGMAGPAVPFLTGGANGDLGGSVSLDDSANFFSDFNQQFTPGSTLTFTMDSTLVLPPGGTPDNFSMAILDGYDTTNGYSPGFPPTGGTPISTQDPTGNNNFLYFDINGPGQTTVQAWNSTTGDITITVASAGVPEPSGLVLALTGSGMLGLSAAWRRRRT